MQRFRTIQSGKQENLTIFLLFYFQCSKISIEKNNIKNISKIKENYNEYFINLSILNNKEQNHKL